MSLCCTHCFSEPQIQQFIERADTIGNCDYCESTKVPVCDVSEVGSFIADAIHRYYEDAANRVGYSTADGGYQMSTDTISEILLYELDIFGRALSSPDLLVRDLVDDDGTPYVRRAPYSPPPGEPDEIRYWDQFCKIIMNSQRFTAFRATEEIGFQEEHPANFLRHIADSLNSALLIWDMPAGSHIYRGRIMEGNARFRHEDITSPPAAISGSNRMSPAGISFFYGCFEPETCIAEVRPSVGDRIAVAEFELLLPLTILDLSQRLDESLTIFDEEYIFEYEEYLKPFLRHFVADIAKPIRPHEAEIFYVPTQAFTEFIRMHDFIDPFSGMPQFGPGASREPVSHTTFRVNGIIYGSSLRSNGRNITLFRGSDISITNSDRNSNTWLRYNGYRVYELGEISYSAHPVGHRTWRRHRR